MRAFVLGGKGCRRFAEHFFESIGKVRLALYSYLHHYLAHGYVFFDNQLGGFTQTAMQHELYNRFPRQALHLCIQLAPAHHQLLGYEVDVHLRLVYVLLNEGYQLFEELGILLVGREFTTVGLMVLGVVLLELVAVPEKVEDGKVEIGQVYRLLKV